jgi:hypothetical protein
MQQDSHQLVSLESHRTSAAPGIVLLAASLLEVLGMLHHPSLHTSDVAQAIEQMTRFSTLSGVAGQSADPVVVPSPQPILCQFRGGCDVDRNRLLVS